MARFDIDRCQSAEMLSCRLSPAIVGQDFAVCFRFGGLVNAFRFGVLLGGGEIAAFAADFAVGGFAGPSACAVFGRDVNTFVGLGPVFWFFHQLMVAHAMLAGCRVFTPWRAGSLSVIFPLMQIPDNFGNSAVAAGDAVRGNETEEPLFGDPRWVDERLQALRGESEREV